jgi:hypothetical protein
MGASFVKISGSAHPAYAREELGGSAVWPRLHPDARPLAVPILAEGQSGSSSWLSTKEERMREVYQSIPDQIVSQLEKGVRPWHEPRNAGHTTGRVCLPLRHNGICPQPKLATQEDVQTEPLPSSPPAYQIARAVSHRQGDNIGLLEAQEHMGRSVQTSAERPP